MSIVRADLVFSLIVQDDHSQLSLLSRSPGVVALCPGQRPPWLGPESPKSRKTSVFYLCVVFELLNGVIMSARNTIFLSVCIGLIGLIDICNVSCPHGFASRNALVSTQERHYRY